METSLLTSVSIVPATVSLNGSLGRVVEAGLLSAPQVESVVCAVEAHAWRLASGARAGFVLGDGAGVGKGRQLAAVILDSWLRGRDRHVWVSVSHELLHDARRDLQELGAGFIAEHVRDLSDFDYCRLDGKINGFQKGVLFTTYSGEWCGAVQGACREYKVKHI